MDELVSLYESRRNVLISECKRIGWDVIAPTASFFAWLPVPKGYTSESFTKLLLDKADIAVAPGHAFGKYGEGYIRVGLLENEDRLKEAVQGLKNSLYFREKITKIGSHIKKARNNLLAFLN